MCISRIFAGGMIVFSFTVPPLTRSGFFCLSFRSRNSFSMFFAPLCQEEGVAKNRGKPSRQLQASFSLFFFLLLLILLLGSFLLSYSFLPARHLQAIRRSRVPRRGRRWEGKFENSKWTPSSSFPPFLPNPSLPLSSPFFFLLLSLFLSSLSPHISASASCPG